jgi:pyridoxal phosphate enzyme (YggS family)
VTPSDELAANLLHVRDRIAAAARAAGREPSDVTLVAVTKTLPARVVADAHALGVADFGENYANELARKRDTAPDSRWHYIGVLQSHTANRVADLADVVHSAVPGRALERLARRASANGRRIPVLIQVDEAGRENGVRPEEAADAVDLARSLEGVEPVGLMTLPPVPEDPEDSRPVFARLRDLRDTLRKRFETIVELSMGMSLDYEIAVEEGATMVRVGTALFGPRARDTRPSD